MKIVLQITEGCTCYAHTINDIDYKDLVNKNSDDYNPDLINNIFDKMYDELEKQNISTLTLELIDYIRAYHSIKDLKYLFTFMFEHNKNKKIIDTWTCDECLDTVTVKELTIEIEDI